MEKMSYCHDCFNSGWNFEPSMGWVGCHCGRCEDEDGNNTVKPTFGTWLHFIVRDGVVEALKEIKRQQEERSFNGKEMDV